MWGIMLAVATVDDLARMDRAIARAATVRMVASPNPWVGAVLVTSDGVFHDGATGVPGGPHAEVEALASAGPAAAGATLYVTLEPCSHHGRTPPCADALIAAGVARVVLAVEDPDPRVRGRGIARLQAGGITVEVGVRAHEVARQLAPYLKHRSTGRPWVVLKMAATLDGRISAADGTSRWITGDAARDDAHRLRAESDAVLVGAGTVRADDPELTVRRVPGRDPMRVVLGEAPPGARVHPALEVSGDLGDVLDDLGRRGIVQLLVEGGAGVAHAFHAAGLVDRYVFYLAPALFGGHDARGLFSGAGARSIGDLWRGRIVDVARVGDDLRVELAPTNGDR